MDRQRAQELVFQQTQVILQLDMSEVAEAITNLSSSIFQILTTQVWIKMKIITRLLVEKSALEATVFSLDITRNPRRRRKHLTKKDGSTQVMLVF